VWDFVSDFILLTIWDAVERRLPRPVRIGCYAVMGLMIAALLGFVVADWIQ
jgi:hypothetical protein